jgi:hypothetical protein
LDGGHVEVRPLVLRHVKRPDRISRISRQRPDTAAVVYPGRTRPHQPARAVRTDRRPGFKRETLAA